MSEETSRIIYHREVVFHWTLIMQMDFLRHFHVTEESEMMRSHFFAVQNIKKKNSWIDESLKRKKKEGDATARDRMRQTKKETDIKSIIDIKEGISVKKKNG